ncbi:Cochaperone protein [Podochytrium sp. JEL0797]|nr:Cochaperone protein [Podochytrium sp. JEL0797]
MANTGTFEASLASKALAASDFPSALSHATTAIAQHPSASHFLLRSTAHLALNKGREALLDANSALLAADKASPPETSVAARAWLAKAKAQKMIGNEQGAEKSLLEARKRGCKDPLEGSAEPAATAQPLQPTTVTVPPPQPKASQIRHEWFQNDNFVTISILVKGLPKNDSEVVQVEYTDTSLCVTIKLTSGSDYVLDLDPLYEPIVPTDSKHAILNTKIELKLKKKTIGLKWADLERSTPSDPTTAPIASAASGTAAAPVYPSSSKKQTNWDAVVKDHEEDKPEGEAALHALFKNIYKDASDETRKAMVKSYQESGGTCLSTNWAEIGAKKVEVTPPEGMIAKKFEM